MQEKSIRVSRVEREIHHLVALYLQHELADPMPAPASVTAVDVTSDLRKASVYFRLLGEAADVAASERILSDHKRMVQRRVADLRLKFCPVLEFRYGQAREADEVDRLLAELTSKRSHWE